MLGYIIALLGGVCVGALIVHINTRPCRGQGERALSRRYREFQRLRVHTNILAWGADDRPVTGTAYRVWATVSSVDDEGIAVRWASPLPVASNGVVAQRPVISEVYSWSDLNNRRWWQPLTAWY
ncbi:hypothetical protein K2Z83_27715 [Oscillochloris sp. ZM17-4]|uniref:hypothetical protein n=1 Tax=Oscillochloris sp. ZM17-4 TaxID=2866714 RepID=UPI001C73B6D6|nr:hypothetical protein [Oscillochloris sp. ZM17-4]MBX0331445.1 hypothetical protein [Oscillochloris sp. ZM17-4]